MSGYAFTWLRSNGSFVGNWDIKPVVGMMPEKVASAMSDLNMLGATYEPIAYLGSQQANGVNHAVLAEQTIISGTDHKNIVLMKFNESNTSMECSLFAIEPILQEGPAFGGNKINAVVGDDIPSEAIESFNKIMRNYIGVDVKPIALLATKITKGVSYTFAAQVAPVVPNPIQSINLITINTLANTIDFQDVI